MTLQLSRNGIVVLSILFATFALIIAIPDAPGQSVSNSSVFAGAVVILIIIYGINIWLHRKETRKITDIYLVISAGLFLWELLLGKFALMDPFLFPGPARVFAIFGNDYPVMILGTVNSLGLLGAGYALALATAIPLGLFIGWRKRLFDVAYPIAKAVSPIPPTAYLPYTIVLLPTFASASIFLIFIGAFWPILVGAIYGVFSIDRRLINSSRTLGLSEYIMVKKVLFPAALPSIFSGALISLIMSFITLTVAEMIAATSGLGWYIQYNHDFANYDKVIAGILLIAGVVIVMMYFFDRIQAYCLRWQNP